MSVDVWDPQAPLPAATREDNTSDVHVSSKTATAVEASEVQKHDEVDENAMPLPDIYLKVKKLGVPLDALPVKKRPYLRLAMESPARRQVRITHICCYLLLMPRTPKLGLCHPDCSWSLAVEYVGHFHAFLWQAALEASERADQCAHTAFDDALGFLTAEQAVSHHDAMPPVVPPLYRYQPPTMLVPCRA